jgi:hypothetical protein
MCSLSHRLAAAIIEPSGSWEAPFGGHQLNFCDPDGIAIAF